VVAGSSVWFSVPMSPRYSLVAILGFSHLSPPRNAAPPHRSLSAADGKNVDTYAPSPLLLTRRRLFYVAGGSRLHLLMPTAIYLRDARSVSPAAASPNAAL